MILESTQKDNADRMAEIEWCVRLFLFLSMHRPVSDSSIITPAIASENCVWNESYRVSLEINGRCVWPNSRRSN